MFKCCYGKMSFVNNPVCWTRFNVITKDIPLVISKSCENVRIYSQAQTAADVISKPLSVAIYCSSDTNIFSLYIYGKHNELVACTYA